MSKTEGNSIKSSKIEYNNAQIKRYIYYMNVQFLQTNYLRNISLQRRNAIGIQQIICLCCLLNHIVQQRLSLMHEFCYIHAQGEYHNVKKITYQLFFLYRNVRSSYISNVSSLSSEQLSSYVRRAIQTYTIFNNCLDTIHSFYGQILC